MRETLATCEELRAAGITDTRYLCDQARLRWEALKIRTRPFWERNERELAKMEATTRRLGAVQRHVYRWLATQ